MLLLAFSLDSRIFAVGIGSVENVTRAVEVTPLPDSPESVLGIVNMHGEIVPVINIRGLLRLPEKDVCPGDCMIIARAPARRLGFLADSISGVVEYPEAQVTAADGLDSPDGYTAGVMKLGGAMAVILDIEGLASRAEAG